SLPVVMARPGPLELANQVVDRDELLRPRFQIPNLDLAVGKLVADDHREVGAVSSGRLELLAELPLAQLRPGDEPRRSERRRDPQALRGGRRIRPDDDGDRSRLGGRRRALLVEGEEDAIEPQPEADAGRRPPAEELDEAVVAPAPAERLLLALAAGHVELERGSGVVVEAADEPGLEPERDVERGQVRLDGLEMGPAGVTEPVGDPRRGGV